MHAHASTTGKRILLGLFLAGGLFLSSLAAQAQNVDLPTAPASPIAGIAFDDPPLVLPVQRNFQMAMLLSSSELGRSCGKMEAYGWRLADTEQQRVNQIFNNTVDRLRAQGYAVEAQKANAVSSDVTLFSADRPDKHLVFLWSAGEIGLVMVMCETSAPLSPIPENLLKKADGTQNLAMPTPLSPAEKGAGAVLPEGRSYARALQTSRTTVAGRPYYENFSPIGSWSGTYTCAQGTTGATLRIKKLKGDRFEGSFSFFPSLKNPYVPKGEYLVSGEYDADTMRILINPGKWIERPKDYFNTIIIGSFDPVAESFSGYFQGIMGCTSIEAKLDRADRGQKDDKPGVKAKKKIVKKSAKKPTKKAAKKKIEKIEELALPTPLAPPAKATGAPMPLTAPEVAPGLPQEKAKDALPDAPGASAPLPTLPDAPSPDGITVPGPSNL